MVTTGFLSRLEQTAGSLCRVDSLIVHDVFGGATRDRAGRRAMRARGPAMDDVLDAWTGARRTTLSDVSLFCRPRMPVRRSQRGLVIEEVLFLRDEMANMAWAVGVHDGKRDRQTLAWA